jgi:ABC-type nitrate/sulfonate/bicarbonate transport system permease component
MIIALGDIIMQERHQNPFQFWHIVQSYRLAVLLVLFLVALFGGMVIAAALGISNGVGLHYADAIREMFRPFILFRMTIV